jgi:hypothetical protein
MLKTEASNEPEVNGTPNDETGPRGGRRGMMRVPWVSGMRPGHGYDYGARAALNCPFATVPPDTWPQAATSLSSDLRIYRVESVEDLQEKLKIQEDVKGSYALFSSGINGQFIRSVSINTYSLYFLIKAYAINQEEFVSADLTKLFSPEARSLPANDFQNSYGDYYVAGRVKGSAFFALLEVKTQSDEIKMEIIKELNVGLQAGEMPASFAATFGTQFRKAATHQGVSFALHVAEFGQCPEVVAAQAVAAAAARAEASALLEAQRLQKEFNDQQTAARAETMEICNELKLGLNRLKTATDKFLLEGKTAFDRLTSQITYSGLSPETRSALDSFKKSCESDLNPRLSVDLKDSAGSLKAFGDYLSPIVERFEKKMAALPADENPSQYVEFDLLNWNSFRSKFQKAASDWRPLA